MGITLLIDFGSTYTKIRAVDLEREEVIGGFQVPSTVDTDMTIGLQAAYNGLLAETGISDADINRKLACSSAAGGLQIVAIGLVPKLTTEAAKRAAFGAGGKVIGVYSYKLAPKEAKELVQKRPDLILLVGGTDGGDTEVILHNARIVANSDLVCSIILAGNKVVADEAEQVLKASGKHVVVTDNVMPEVNQLNIEPANLAIRSMFMERIVHGKGLDKAKEFVGGIIMPTPMAVLNGASLLARGTSHEKGLGDLIVVDVGGATTDVDSLAEGCSSRPDVIQKGLPEPYAKRTVEGDLGIRYSASHIFEMAGEEQLLRNMKINSEKLPCKMEKGQLKSKVRYRSEHIEFVPQDEIDSLVDVSLACTATEVAMKRHAGVIEVFYTPSGTIHFQRGKDLTGVKRVIGTGGIFSYGKCQRWILERVKYNENDPFSLRPKNPAFFVDELYILYAAGLLAEIAPEKALRIMKRHLRCSA